MTDRPAWDQTFSEIAKVWSQRSTCSRRQVGAVIVQGNRIIGQGYNGVASGKVHCIDGGCPRGLLSHDEVPKDADYNVYPCKALHAEYQAITDAGKKNCEGATIYVTDSPCLQCTNMIEDAKIERVVILTTRDSSQATPGVAEG